MAWPEYIHHISLHFPIVGTLFVGAVGVRWVLVGGDNLAEVVRVGGWVVFLVTTAAMVSGIVAAPGWFGGDGPEGLSHHRNMGVTVWCITATAAVGFEIGCRTGVEYLRRFAALCWCAAAFGAIGAGHWGGSALHSDEVPWDGSPPILQESDG